MKLGYDWTTVENYGLLRLALPRLKFSMKSFSHFFWADGESPCSKANHRDCGRDSNRYCRWNPLELSYRRFIKRHGLISKNKYVIRKIEEMLHRDYLRAISG